MATVHSTAPAITLPEEDRAAFVVKVYQHVLAAVGVFVGIEALFFATGIAEGLYDFFSSGGISWLLLLGAFMIGQWFVANAVSDLANPARQYGGLVGSAGMYAVLFAPLLHYVYRVQDSGSTVAAAAVITAIGFGLLSVVAFVTRKDLSFLRPLVMWGFGAALLLIIGAVIFGLNLGVWFSVAMIGLSGAAILYQTQSIIRHFPGDAYVAGAVQLFGSLMTMFYYVIQLLMQLTRN